MYVPNSRAVRVCLQDGALQGLECFPVPIMRWTESFYIDVFRKHGDFKLQEHGAHVGNIAGAAAGQLSYMINCCSQPGLARRRSTK
jgi:hypothetical protein